MLVVGALLAAALAADEPLAVKGVTLGMSAEEVREAWGREQVDCSKRGIWGGKFKPGDSGFCHRYRVTFAGVAVPAFQAELTDDRVTKVYIPAIRPLTINTIANALIEKYGPPVIDDDSPSQNAMGATFDNRAMMWIRDGAVLHLIKRFENLDEGYLYLIPETDPADVKADAVERAKDI